MGMAALNPKEVSHTSRTPTRSFSRPSTKNPDKSPLYKFSPNCSRGFCPGGLSGGLLSGRFCPGWFLSIPPSVTRHLLQEKVKLHYKFHETSHKHISNNFSCDSGGISRRRGITLTVCL